MSAAAGVLGIELEKAGHYCLGRGHRPPTASDIARAIGLLLFSTTFACLVFGGLFFVVKLTP
jgi:cobalamin biosynthesis protein CobD/CbiB